MGIGRAPRFAYQVPSPSTPPPQDLSSRTEVIHILIAFMVLALDFWLIRSGATGAGSVFIGQGFPAHATLLLAIPPALLIAATGFVSHEMAHKLSAQRMGLWAEFRMAPMWLLLSVLGAAVAGILFAAPGATYVRGVGTKQESGLTSLAGPAVNLAWTGIFLGIALLTLHNAGYAYWTGVFVLVALLNTWFAAFNLIPFGPLDGKKVMQWNRGVWVGALVAAVVLFIFIAFYFP